jgi:acylpyruvate hydrolase
MSVGYMFLKIDILYLGLSFPFNKLFFYLNSFFKEENAMNHVLGYVLALDMTARHIQDKLKKAGHPWLLAKGFDTSCPISDFIPESQVADVNNLNLVLKVNDVVKQNGNTSDMIYKLPTLIAYISKYFKLEYGDLILTGTPSGVSPVKHGDIIEANLNDLAKIKFSVVELPPQ